MMDTDTVSSVISLSDSTATLPTELLSHIFSFLVLIYPLNLDADIGQRLGWVAVSHVSRRWRSTALNTPSLWTRLSPDLGPAWDTFIERSKAAPLFIEGRLDMQDAIYMPDLLPSIHKHQERIQELALSKVSPPIFSRLFDGLNGSPYSLRALSIMTCQYDFPIPHLPRSFLSEIAPNLRELRLSGVDFPRCGDSPLFVNLEILFFDDGPRTARKVTASLSDIIFALSRMPALRILRLIMTLPESTLSIGAPSISPVLVSNAEVLVIESTNDTAWHLWPYLRVPSSADVHVRSPHKTSVEALIVSTLKEHLSTSSAPHTLGIFPYATGYAENLTFHLHGLPNGHGSSSMQDSHPVRHQPSVELDICITEARPLLKKIMALLATDCIHTLRVASGIQWNYDMFYELLLPLHSVERLRLGSGAGAMCAALDPSHISPRDRILFPALTEIHIAASSLRPDLYMAVHGISSQLKDILYRMLKCRDQLGLNHLRLVLQHNKGWEECVAGMGIDGKVSWNDGIAGMF